MLKDKLSQGTSLPKTFRQLDVTLDVTSEVFTMAQRPESPVTSPPPSHTPSVPAWLARWLVEHTEHGHWGPLHLPFLQPGAPARSLCMMGSLASWGPSPNVTFSDPAKLKIIPCQASSSPPTFPYSLCLPDRPLIGSCVYCTTLNVSSGRAGTSSGPFSVAP